MKMKYLLLILILSSKAWSNDALDNYYSDDLLDAVSQAKEQPHHYDYSNSYRYKRTTAQSIELNRLNLHELDETRLSSHKSISSSANSNVKHDNNSIELVDTDRDAPSSLTRQTEIKPVFSNTAPLNSSYQNSAGSYHTSGIVQNGSLTSTPRP